MALPLLQVFAEGLPQLLRCVIVVCGVLLAPHWGVLIFSTAQVRMVVICFKLFFECQLLVPW